jgi:hypothetical protein
MPKITIPQDTWVSLGTGLASAIIEAADEGALLFIGAAAPTNNDVAFSLPAGYPFSPPNVSALGGGIWIKSIVKETVVKYVTA